MATINSSDVLSSIVAYIENNDRPCPAHYLIDKFGDDVAESIAELKRDAKVIGRRGRNGGIVLPDTVFAKKSIVATPVHISEDVKDTDSDNDMNIDELA